MLIDITLGCKKGKHEGCKSDWCSCDCHIPLSPVKECQCNECKIRPHFSDCAVHNKPAFPKGECTCQPSEEKECVCLDIKQPHPMCPIHVPKQDWEERLVDMMDGFYSDMAINKVKSFIRQLLKDERGKVIEELDRISQNIYQTPDEMLRNLIKEIEELKK